MNGRSYRVLKEKPGERNDHVIVGNPTDKTASFSLINKVYQQPSPRSFNEAKGLVMNDYQTMLEEEWIKALKKKYPVVVDQKVLAQILK